MAASVHNRQFHLEPSLNGVGRFKSGPTHRSDSPVRTFNLTPDFTRSNQKPDPYTMEEDYSSDDEADYKDLIRKGNSELEPSIFDPRDEGTADNWVERNPSMIRLTGKHPFNCEAPLPMLMHHGFITPVPLHYVRSHGAVPKTSWSDWTVEICGLVKRPTRFTMNQLVNEFPSREFPVTLVCAGNRRKEQNMVKQTIGFNWGAGGVSTSVWRGVPLHLILKRCGIYSRKKGALNVCFEGAEDLPGGGGSKYGTSIRKEYAMDPARDIILAYMQNGELLAPDHGYPVRMIIPGFIGGRMVKWLKRIIVTTKESDSYYHYKDNRVLPSHVDAELANAEGWWYKPEYIINELNINSVITTPTHEEILPINSWTTQMPYRLKGYAYSGGGKKVTRVEVTMDGGETWQVCTLDHLEKPNKYGKYWCWCFWSLEVEVLDLLGAKEIAVRAWDQALSTQPEKLIWNVMLKRLELKLKQFAEVETFLMRECEQVEKTRLRFVAEHARFLAMRNGPPMSASQMNIAGVSPSMVNNNVGSNRQQVMPTTSSQPSVSGYGNNQQAHPRMPFMQLGQPQPMLPLGPRQPLTAMQPSSSVPSNAMFNASGNSQSSLNQMLRSVSG